MEPFCQTVYEGSGLQGKDLLASNTVGINILIFVLTLSTQMILYIGRSNISRIFVDFLVKIIYMECTITPMRFLGYNQPRPWGSLLLPLL